MVWRWVTVAMKWAVVLGLLGGLVWVARWVNGQSRAEIAREDEEGAEARRAEAGVVTLGAEVADRLGIEEAGARAVSWTERTTVYGMVVPNPRAAVEIRSPYAGTLRADPEADWPAPGRWVEAGRTVGWIDLRVQAQERLTLQDNLNSARLTEEGAERVVALQRERVRRIESVSESQIVPGQQLDDAKVLLAEAETKLEIARAAVELWQEALAEVDQPGRGASTTYSRPLTAPAAGEVVEVAALPGADIEAGGPVATLVDFRRPLVRLDLPPRLLTAGPPSSVHLLARPEADIGDPGPAAALEAVPVGPAPRVDGASQFVGYWYEPSEAAPEGGGPGVLWRPGRRVTATVTPLGASAAEAVAVPLGAVLVHQGRSLAYVRVGPGTYERREVRALGRDGGSWVLAAGRGPGPVGVEPGEAVVARGGQALLSEEFRVEMDDD